MTVNKEHWFPLCTFGLPSRNCSLLSVESKGKFGVSFISPKRRVGGGSENGFTGVRRRYNTAWMSTTALTSFYVNSDEKIRNISRRGLECVLYRPLRHSAGKKVVENSRRREGGSGGKNTAAAVAVAVGAAATMARI